MPKTLKNAIGFVRACTERICGLSAQSLAYIQKSETLAQASRGWGWILLVWSPLLPVKMNLCQKCLRRSLRFC